MGNNCLPGSKRDRGLLSNSIIIFFMSNDVSVNSSLKLLEVGS